MTIFGSLKFFIDLVLLLIPAIILGICQKSMKLYRIFASIVIIILVIGSDTKQLVFITLFYFIQLHLVKIYLLLRKKFGRNEAIYLHFVAFSIMPLAVSKVAGLVEFNIFQFIGISYITFRVVQIIIETYDEVITEINTLNFTGFILFFPTLSCGPIDRSRRFDEDSNKVFPRKEYLDLLGDGLYKILLGLVYKFVIASLFFKWMGICELHKTVLGYIGYSYNYGFYMFFDFAGYSLMAIGTSYIFGIRTPENFNKPFISKDMKEFWDRWHITLSHWFRDFIFSRFMMRSIKKKWFKKRLNGAACGFIVNMLVMGIWHGLTVYYILYGLYHGVLLALTEIFQKKSKFYKNNKDKNWYKVVSWFVTINLVMFGFLIFSGRFTSTLQILVNRMF